MPLDAIASWRVAWDLVGVSACPPQVSPQKKNVFS